MSKYSISHKLSTTYHPQTNGQVEVTNRQIKLILEKIVGQNRKYWSVKLIDAPWAYRTAYKTVHGMSPYRVVFGKPYHLSIELDHRVLWAIKQLNFDLSKVSDLQKLHNSELEVIRKEAYDNAKITKSRTKFFHDWSNHRKIFDPGQKVLLYNFRLHLFIEKLKTRWSGPFIVHAVFSYGAVKISDLKDGKFSKWTGKDWSHS